MMSITTPIMVSNFHSLYINSVVGEPSTIKKAVKEEEASCESSMSNRSPTSSTGEPYVAPWKRPSFRFSTGDMQQTSHSLQQRSGFDEVEVHKETRHGFLARCGAPLKSRLACVHPRSSITSVSNDKPRRKITAGSARSTPRTRKSFATLVSNALSLSLSLSLSLLLTCQYTLAF